PSTPRPPRPAEPVGREGTATSGNGRAPRPPLRPPPRRSRPAPPPPPRPALPPLRPRGHRRVPTPLHPTPNTQHPPQRETQRLNIDRAPARCPSSAPARARPPQHHLGPPAAETHPAPPAVRRP